VTAQIKTSERRLIQHKPMSSVEARQPLLLGIDLEDVRDQIPNGHQYQDSLKGNVLRLLKSLGESQAKGTFFTVGALARRHPELIREIASQGHEIAAHGDNHTQLTKMTPKEFAEDLKRNLSALAEAQSNNVVGFRAPTFSLTPKTQWAYEILAEHGVTYSSSVLPARNPLFGWPDFGLHARVVSETSGVLEIPMTLHAKPLPQVPLAGGIYLRVVPFALTLWSLKRQNSQAPITTYIHPYDIDTAQERFMHPDLNENKAMNWLMYVNRDKALHRLGQLIGKCSVWRYCDWVEKWRVSQESA
jgi:polysaccharide deacetylase family protein (PEP-CTERM system associated)